MMTSGAVQLWKGKVLKDGGKVSTGEDCCCGEDDCTCAECSDRVGFPNFWVLLYQFGMFGEFDICASCADLNGLYYVDKPGSEIGGFPLTDEQLCCCKYHDLLTPVCGYERLTVSLIHRTVGFGAPDVSLYVKLGPKWHPFGRTGCPDLRPGAPADSILARIRLNAGSTTECCAINETITSATHDGATIEGNCLALIGGLGNFIVKADCGGSPPTVPP